jgi:hypothetical protein
LLDLARLADVEVVEHHHVALAQARREHLGEVSVEGGGVYGPVSVITAKQPAPERQPPDYRGLLPVVARGQGVDALAARYENAGANTT